MDFPFSSLHSNHIDSNIKLALDSIGPNDEFWFRFEERRYAAQFWTVCKEKTVDTENVSV